MNKDEPHLKLGSVTSCREEKSTIACQSDVCLTGGVWVMHT
jgi:hypothetical protein